MIHRLIYWAILQSNILRLNDCTKVKCTLHVNNNWPTLKQFSLHTNSRTCSSCLNAWKAVNSVDARLCSIVSPVRSCARVLWDHILKAHMGTGQLWVKCSPLKIKWGSERNLIPLNSIVPVTQQWVSDRYYEVCLRFRNTRADGAFSLSFLDTRYLPY